MIRTSRLTARLIGMCLLGLLWSLPATALDVRIVTGLDDPDLNADLEAASRLIALQNADGPVNSQDVIAAATADYERLVTTFYRYGRYAPVVAECEVRVHERERPADVVAAFGDKYQWDITMDEDVDVGRVVLWEVTPVKWLFAGPA